MLVDGALLHLMLLLAFLASFVRLINWLAGFTLPKSLVHGVQLCGDLVQPSVRFDLKIMLLFVLDSFLFHGFVEHLQL